MVNQKYDAIVIGGSYSGLAAAMGLGRALRKVLVIDSGLPSNRFTAEAHNFLTHDGSSPGEILRAAREQIRRYQTVTFLNGVAVAARLERDTFHVTIENGETHLASKLVLATGIIDQLPGISGLAECWGKSVLHCPYCHGYEVRGAKTAILGNGDYALEFSSLISNWTFDLTLLTNGQSTLTVDQASKIASQNIKIIENDIESIHHVDGYVDRILFNDRPPILIDAIYTKPRLQQHSNLASMLGCEMSDEGYIKVDGAQRTTIPGVYACGDNSSKMRTLANAISMGTTTAISLNKELVAERF